MMRQIIHTLALTAMLAVPVIAADDKPAAPAPGDVKTFMLKTQDIKDTPITVPKSDAVTVIVYVMVGQQRSHEALANVQRILAERPKVQAMAVVSGTNATIDARRLGELAAWNRPVLADPDYKISDAGKARAWPTTLIVGSDGKWVAHIGGLTTTYIKDVNAYLDFASGAIDEPTLKKRLASHDVVAATPQHITDRHLAVAQRLIAQGLYTQALDELKRAQEIQPDDPRVKLAIGRIMVMTGKPADALQTLDQIKADNIAAWQIHAVRGRALAAMGEWDKARTELVESVKQNPAPAECYYDLGRAYQHDGKFEKATEAFRAAYESRRATEAPTATPPQP
ncbi:tetratricopeptide repeat protein [Planctomycetales bacterium ZRK34]|nr:tetratricopeptide repeat protein [Planctomycetales bacterium ZRK34]